MNDLEWKASREFSLTPGEARTFLLLKESENYCPSRLIHADSNTRKVLISNLRRKLERRFDIQNIRGRGYLMEARIEASGGGG
jgi:DNA-binding response OmpR family regulator